MQRVSITRIHRAHIRHLANRDHAMMRPLLNRSTCRHDKHPISLDNGVKKTGYVMADFLAAYESKAGLFSVQCYTKYAILYEFCSCKLMFVQQ